MVTLMTMNHLGSIPNLFPDRLNVLITFSSRCVAPMFAFFAAKGIKKSNNIKSYCFRLSLLASIVQLGNMIISYIVKNGMNQMPPSVLGNSIIGIALSVDAIYLLDKYPRRKIIFFLSVIMFIIGFLYGEEGTVIVPIILLEYYFAEKSRARIIGYMLIEILAIVIPFGEPFFFLFIPFTFLYNGMEGKKTRFFYYYYPLHIWCIAILSILSTMTIQSS